MIHCTRPECQTTAGCTCSSRLYEHDRLRAEIAALKAENERLTRERDKFIREAGGHFTKSCELADRALQPILVTDEMVEAGFRAFSGKILMREEDESLVRSVIEAALAAGQSIVDEDDDYYCPKCGGGADACRSTGCPGDEPSAPKGQQEAVRERIVRAIIDHVVDGDPETPEALADFILALTRPAEQAVTDEPARKFALGDRVTKTRGSSWTGRVVGFYSTSLTPVGYCVESETETGSVQIYPEAALAFADIREAFDGDRP